MADKDVLEEAKEAFDDCAEAEAENRLIFEADYRFCRLGDQWPDEARRLRGAGRPALTLNRMPAFIRQVTNDVRQNRPSIKVHPTDSKADPRTAEVLTGAIRNIEYQSNADSAYDWAGDMACSGGWGYWRVDVDWAADDSFDKDIFIRRILDPLSVYADPKSTEVDSSDWNVAFVVEHMTHDEFEAQYKGAEKVDWESDYRSHHGGGWVDESTVRVAEYWSRKAVTAKLLSIRLLDGQTIAVLEDDLSEEMVYDLTDGGAIPLDIAAARETVTHKVTQRILTSAEVLETTEWAGKHIPIVPVYGEEVMDYEDNGERRFYNLTHHGHDAQRMFNYWRTTSTEMVALQPKAPWVGPAGSFETDAARWNTANTENHAVLEYDPVPGAAPPTRVQPPAIAQGALQESMNSADDMKAILGIYDAALGAQSNEIAGVAIAARQREGDVSSFHFPDNVARAIRHTGRILVDLIPKVYSEPRLLRILEEDETPRNVMINQRFQARNEQGEITDMIYDVAAGKYDVTVKAGPSYTTQRQESATQMMQLMQAMPEAAPVMGDLVAKNLDWPGADEIAKRLETLLPGALKGSDPEKAAMQQQIQQLIGIIEQLRAGRDLKAKETAVKEFEAQTDRFEAETDRMEAETDRMEAETDRVAGSMMPQGPIGTGYPRY